MDVTLNVRVQNISSFSKKVPIIMEDTAAYFFQNPGKLHCATYTEPANEANYKWEIRAASDKEKGFTR